MTPEQRQANLKRASKLVVPKKAQTTLKKSINLPSVEKIHYVCEHGIDHYHTAFCNTCMRRAMEAS